MIRNRFFKTTLGFFAELAIVKALDASNSSAFQATLAAFVTSGLAGTLWAGWEDDSTALAAGDTADADNIGRKFFYAWKQSDGTLKRTVGIPVETRKYSSIAYNAGTAQVRTITFGGTYSLGQKVHVRLIETTGTHQPFPQYVYEAEIGASGINAAVTALAAAINAELANNDPLATASASTTVLTITCKDKIRNFKTVSFVETTTAQPTDASAITFAETVKQVYPIGSVADVKELVRYSNINQGGIDYAPEGLLPTDFGQIASNLDETGTTTYGFVLVTYFQTETGGVMEPEEKHRNYVLIAIKTADVAALAAL